MDMGQAASKWRRLSEEVIEGLSGWRAQHPQATLGEIEQKLDEGLAGLRAQMLEDTAQASEVRAWDGADEGPPCPECGTALKGRGQHRRHLQTNGGQEIILEREYGQCPRCGRGFFPPG